MATPEEAALVAAVPQTLIDHIMARIAAAQATAVGYNHVTTWQNCHCNADDCPNCVKRAQVGTDLVLAAHERLYPGLKEAAELAQLGTPTAMARALKKQESTVADLVAMMVQLTAGQQQLAMAVARLMPKADPAPAMPPPGVPVLDGSTAVDAAKVDPKG